MSVTTMTDESGNKYWYLDRMLHRDDDLPAVEYINGNKYWYKNGKLHRDGDLPAIEYANGDKHWYQHSKHHRDGGRPAIEYASGTKSWCIYGKFCTREELVAYYSCLVNFGRYCLKKIRQRRLKQVRWIHGELLCRPPRGNFLGGQDYHRMTNYFNKL